MVKGKALTDEEFEREVNIRISDINKALAEASPEQKQLLEETTILKRNQVRRRRNENT